MAPHGSNPLFGHFTQDIRIAVVTDPETRAQELSNSTTNRSPGVFGWLSHEVFRRDCLDRRLERHHITGIAFSGAVGIGIFTIPGEIMALGGPVGALLAFILASLVIFCVMRCLAEMVSVRPNGKNEANHSDQVSAPLIDFPHTFVDEALGFTVGIMYWQANCMSMVTLTIAAAMFIQYWPSNFGMTSATFVLLLVMFFMNACGVQLYGRMEWVFKWLKIAILIGSIILMILIRAGIGPGKVDGNYGISPGYKPTGFFAGDKAAIGGTGGRILMVWTCTTTAMFQFMGGEMALVTSGEAKRPMRDLPIAARYMYLLPISFYLVAMLFLGLNVNYLDPRLYHPHIGNIGPSRLQGLQTAAISPFVIAIEKAGIKVLPGFLDACFTFSALTAAIKFYKRTIDRDSQSYRVRHYRAHWQPLWAILGFILCTLLMLFSGWNAIYNLYAKSPGVNWRDSVVDLGASYLGVSLLVLSTVRKEIHSNHHSQPLIFGIVCIAYKLIKKTTIRDMNDMRDVWFVKDVPIEDDEKDDNHTSRNRPRNRFWEFLSWVR
ncbi:MAG: hypothetical protein Q9202_003063 [Teloschistes flavicans]